MDAVDPKKNRITIINKQQTIVKYKRVFTT